MKEIIEKMNTLYDMKATIERANQLKFDRILELLESINEAVWLIKNDK